MHPNNVKYWEKAQEVFALGPGPRAIQDALKDAGVVFLRIPGPGVALLKQQAHWRKSRPPVKRRERPENRN
jgi:hypothetical protein